MRWRVFIYDTMIAYGVKITAKGSYHRYDLGVKGEGQGQINLKSVLWLAMPSPLKIFDKGCSYLEQ